MASSSSGTYRCVFFFPSFCTFRCIFCLQLDQLPILSIPPFSRALMCEKISASAVEGIEAMIESHIRWFDDMCRSGRYVTIHPMPTTVVPSTQMPFPLWMNDSGCFVCVYNLHGRLVSNFLPCKAAVIRDLPRQEQLKGDEAGMFGCTTGSRRKARIFWFLNVLLNGKRNTAKASKTLNLRLIPWGDSC